MIKNNFNIFIIVLIYLASCYTCFSVGLLVCKNNKDYKYMVATEYNGEIGSVIKCDSLHFLSEYEAVLFIDGKKLNLKALKIMVQHNGK